MRRPFSDKRPVGPFVGASGDREYDKVEISINEDYEPYPYSVTGVLQISPESVGIVADTRAVSINGAPISMWEYEQGRPDESVAKGQTGLEITAPEGSKVKMTDVSDLMISIEV